jgi:hypothetical protein
MGKMDIKNKLKYYKGLKEVFPEDLLQVFLNAKTNRQKLIFYNTVKAELTEEEQLVLLADLNLDLSTTENIVHDSEEFRYILVGNIIDKHYAGVEKEIKRGTRLFRPGAKVFLLPKYGGNGHTDIPVYGLPRRSGRKIEIVIRGDMIKNVRVKKTFDPKMIAKIDDSFFYDYFDNNEASLQSFADSMNANRLIDNKEISDESN